MNSIKCFDPFNNRLCRNVRNALSEAFKESVKAKDLHPVEYVAQFFLNETLPACVSDYIHRRLAIYQAVLAELEAKAFTDPMDIALVIWDRRLFFETHEYLEPYWLVARGDEKQLLQALIRAAGTYVHLEQGNLAAAKRIAAKAIDGLGHGAGRLSKYADPQRLLEKLKTLDPVSPMLSGTADQGKSSSGEEAQHFRRSTSGRGLK
jgi:hypothetical protein